MTYLATILTATGAETRHRIEADSLERARQKAEQIRRLLRLPGPVVVTEKPTNDHD